MDLKRGGVIQVDQMQQGNQAEGGVSGKSKHETPMACWVDGRSFKAAERGVGVSHK